MDFIDGALRWGVNLRVVVSNAAAATRALATLQQITGELVEELAAALFVYARERQHGRRQPAPRRRWPITKPEQRQRCGEKLEEFIRRGSQLASRATAANRQQFSRLNCCSPFYDPDSQFRPPAWRLIQLVERTCGASRRSLPTGAKSVAAKAGKECLVVFLLSEFCARQCYLLSQQHRAGWQRIKSSSRIFNQ